MMTCTVHVMTLKKIKCVRYYYMCKYMFKIVNYYASVLVHVIL